jgi:pilus assembly protein Flp/PilA
VSKRRFGGRSTGETGASAVEYGLLVALIALVMLAAVALFGQTMKSKLFDTSCAAVASAAQTSCS